jgi:adenylate cyclase
MISNASTLYKGTIDKFIGDCAMIVFGVPERDPQQHFHAIACAMLIQKTTQKLNEIRRASGRQEVHFRIGINTGSMLAGNMGSHDRMQYTVVGDSVNLASRLSNIAGPDEVIIQEQLYNQLDVHTRVIAHKHGEIPIRGKSLGVKTYIVEDVAMDYQKKMDRQIDQLIAEHNAA